ncbi:MAG: response regulator transcription factor [Proteobacteria bacterium]|nr:response regulator transcription factor [Pseudomonadota bacterium]
MDATPRARILLVDDDPGLSASLQDALETKGYSVDLASGADGGYAIVKRGSIDLLLLDLQLPGVSGQRLIEIVSQGTSGAPPVPIIVMSGNGQEEDKAKALRGGADDYLVKPFAIRELGARIEALLRRARRPRGIQQPVLAFGNLRLNVSSREVRAAGREARLTELECEILSRLIERQGGLVVYRVLAAALSQRFRVVSAANLQFHAMNLRRKLGAAGGSIRTVRGLGLRIVA